MSDKISRTFFVVLIGVLVSLNVTANKITSNTIASLQSIIEIYNSNNRMYLKTLIDIVKQSIRTQKSFEKRIEKIEKYYNGLDIKKITQANVRITNLTRGHTGSGTHIKINNESYILTCAHLFESEKDLITVIVNDFGVNDNTKYKETKILKIDRDVDLAIIKIINRKIDIPYLELAKKRPKYKEEVWICGNPHLLDDIITYGKFEEDLHSKYIVSVKAYFGNSGGSLINRNGELVGVVSVIDFPFWNYPFIDKNKKGMIIETATVSLKAIKNFLKDVK